MTRATSAPQRVYESTAHLLVVPANLLLQWRERLVQRMPRDQGVVVVEWDKAIGDLRDRERALMELAQADIVLVSVEVPFVHWCVCGGG